MVTMKEAITAYDKRYHGGRGMDILKGVIGIKLSDPDTHDMSHIMASGIANIDKPPVESFQLLDKAGLVARNSGMKAELLQYIYDNCSLYGISVSGENVKNYYEKSLPLIFSRYKRSNGEGSLSHIPELDDLIAGYDGIHTKFESVISEEEIAFHTEKALLLYEKLTKEHPECFENGKPDFKKLLGLDLKEFRIDNFTMAEKIKLRAENLDVAQGIRC